MAPGGKTPQSNARDTVARLIAAESRRTSDRDAAAVAAAVAMRTWSGLARYVGRDGSEALIARAVAQAQRKHPALAGIYFSPQSEPAIQGLAQSIQEHGALQAAAGLEATVVALIELLGRLIGEDLALKLIDDVPNSPLDDAGGNEQ